MKECFEVGLYKQGLLHDMSKYSPSLVSPMPSGLANDMIIWGLYPVVNAIGISARRMTF